MKEKLNKLNLKVGYLVQNSILLVLSLIMMVVSIFTGWNIFWIAPASFIISMFAANELIKAYNEGINPHNCEHYQYVGMLFIVLITLPITWPIFVITINIISITVEILDEILQRINKAVQDFDKNKFN